MTEKKFEMIATEKDLRFAHREFRGPFRRAAKRIQQLVFCKRDNRVAGENLMTDKELQMTDLEVSHFQVRAALMLAVEELQKLNADQPLTSLLGRVLREAESVSSHIAA